MSECIQMCQGTFSQLMPGGDLKACLFLGRHHGLAQTKLWYQRGVFGQGAPVDAVNEFRDDALAHHLQGRADGGDVARERQGQDVVAIKDIQEKGDFFDRVIGPGAAPKVVDRSEPH